MVRFPRKRQVTPDIFESNLSLFDSQKEFKRPSVTEKVGRDSGKHSCLDTSKHIWRERTQPLRSSGRFAREHWRTPTHRNPALCALPRSSGSWRPARVRCSTVNQSSCPLADIAGSNFCFSCVAMVVWYLRLLRRNAQRSVQSCKNGEGLPVQVYGDQDIVMQKLPSSPNQPVYIDIVQETSQAFWT